MNFTKTALSTLAPAADGRRSAVFDTKTRGLRLQVTAAGKKTFYLRRKIDDRSERLLIGRFPDLSSNKRETMPPRSTAASVAARIRQR